MTRNPNLQQQQDERADGFAFIGDMVAIDFVNTEMVIRRKPVDLLATEADYFAWWRAARVHYPDLAGDLATEEANPNILPVARRLRGALRTVFEATAADRPVLPDNLAILNRVLASAHDAVTLDPGGAFRRLRVAEGPEADGPLVAVARSAFDLLTGTDLSRLHRCANGRCVLLFYDTTKSATRRWCSTACMNRARSSARYRARKDDADAGT